MPSEIRYEDYRNLICKLSHSYSKISSFSKETLISEANLIFVECQKDYDLGKSKFGTFLYLQISFHFKNFIRSQDKVAKNKSMSVETCIDSNRASDYICAEKTTPECALMKRESYLSLSKEAKDVIDIILNGPAEIIDALSSPILKKITRKNVWSYISCNLGISRARKVQREIKNFVSKLEG